MALNDAETQDGGEKELWGFCAAYGRLLNVLPKGSPLAQAVADYAQRHIDALFALPNAPKGTVARTLRETQQTMNVLLRFRALGEGEQPPCAEAEHETPPIAICSLRYNDLADVAKAERDTDPEDPLIFQEILALASDRHSRPYVAVDGSVPADAPGKLRWIGRKMRDGWRWFRGTREALEERERREALRERSALGYVIASTRGQFLDILALAVKEAARGTGVTDALLAKALHSTMAMAAPNTPPLALTDETARARTWPIRSARELLTALTRIEDMRSYPKVYSTYCSRLRRGLRNPSEPMPPCLGQLLCLLAPVLREDTPHNEIWRCLDAARETVETFRHRMGGDLRALDHPTREGTPEEPAVETAEVPDDALSAIHFLVPTIEDPEVPGASYNQGEHWIEARLEGKPIGIAAYDREGIGVLRLRRFYVAEHFSDPIRERALAALVEKLLRCLRDAKCDRILLPECFYDDETPPVNSESPKKPR